jgi:membrane carboxypeptidase/penicillin-binding protein
VFFFGSETYEPNNYKNEYRGLVTVRTALSALSIWPRSGWQSESGTSAVAGMAQALGPQFQDSGISLGGARSV